jgi:hypothetical protein
MKYLEIELTDLTRGDTLRACVLHETEEPHDETSSLTELCCKRHTHGCRRGPHPLHAQVHCHGMDP